MRLKAEITGMPRSLFFFLIFSVFFLRLYAQGVPDTLQVDYNAALPGSQWQYSFVHLTDVHIGEGAPGDDYGTAGYYDNTAPADAGDPLIRLRKSVYWINDHIQDLKIHFVVITGDLSESAEVSELLRCKQVLDSLEVPYIPVMGNHDAWPLSQGIEESWPAGDSLLNQVFEDAYLSASQYFPQWDDGTRLNRIWHPDHNCYSWFQNFSFDYGSYHFIFADFNSRAHDLGVFNGSAADAELHDFPGGSWPWLQQAVASGQNGDNNMLIFAHHPLSKSLLSGALASFDFNEYDVVTQYLKDYSPRLGAWIAGHKHQADAYAVKTWTFSPEIMMGYETAANWEFPDGHFRLFRMWDTTAPAPLTVHEKDANSFSVFPNPCYSDRVCISMDPECRGFVLSDFSGRIISQVTSSGEKQYFLTVESLPSGVYFIRSLSMPVRIAKFVKMQE